MTDDLDAREKELSALELKVDETDQEARKIRRDLQRDKSAALRRIDHVAVTELNEQLVRNQAVLDSMKEIRDSVGEQWRELEQERARRKEAAWRERHGPPPANALSVASRMTALGLDGHMAAQVAHLVEAQQWARTWGEPEKFMKGATAADLERAAAGLNKVLTMIGDRDGELTAALAQCRDYTRDQIHGRRAPHPWRSPKGVGFP
jgi:hypothetical protein